MEGWDPSAVEAVKAFKTCLNWKINEGCVALMSALIRPVTDLLFNSLEDRPRKIGSRREER